MGREAPLKIKWQTWVRCTPGHRGPVHGLDLGRHRDGSGALPDVAGEVAAEARAYAEGGERLDDVPLQGSRR